MAAASENQCEIASDKQCNGCLGSECVCQCVICALRLSVKQCVCVRNGFTKLLQSSYSKRDGLHGFFKDAEKKEWLWLHTDCRKNYTRRLGPHRPVPWVDHSDRSLRSGEKEFDFLSCCLFCGEEALSDNAHPDRKEVCLVATIDMKDKITNQAHQRGDDEGKRVLLRVSGAMSDLVAADGRYHTECLKSFMKADAPACSDPQRGRPSDSTKAGAFEKLCEWLEDHAAVQHSMSDLLDKMKQLSINNQCYGEKHTRNLLKQRYGEALIVSSGRGSKGYVVTFQGAAFRILSGKWYESRCKSLQSEKERLVDLVAELLREECMAGDYDTDCYPSIDKIASGGEDSVPELMKLFLEKLMRPKRKEAAPLRKRLAMGNSLVAAIRPKSYVSPLHIGVGVFLHRKIGSRLVVDAVSNLGFCASYQEVMKYEDSAVLNGAPEIALDSFLQFIFDNFDHNLRTMTGHGTVHVLAGLMAVTPGDKVAENPRLPRPKARFTAAEVGEKGVMAVVPYYGTKNRGLCQKAMQDVSELALEPDNISQGEGLNILWQSGRVFQTKSCTGWHGFMANVQMPAIQHHAKSAFIPLPIVSLAATDPSAIHTALVYAKSRSGPRPCIVTFDLPLYLKAMDIANSHEASDVLSSVVIRLGGFHLLMSFMGAIGQLMGGSGLADLWMRVYPKNSVTHMMSGHSYARAVRAHFMTQLALATELFVKGVESGEITPDTVRKIQDLHQNIADCDLDPALASPCLSEIKQYLESTLRKEAERSRTGRLWVQYYEQVKVIELFVFAERTADWNLHLYCVQQMIPTLWAAGHFHYAKTAQLYLQEMVDLKNKMSPENYEKFVHKGWFTVFRSDKFFSGTWTDMIIEQVLMRSMKMMGGLTHGRGMTDSTTSRWINSAPHVALVVDSIEQFCGVKSSHSQQHAELGATRKQHDATHADRIHLYLREHWPLDQRPDSLVCISTGLIADPTVNCDRAIEIGWEIARSMIGKAFPDVHYKKKDKCVNIAATNNTIRVGGDKVQVNPTTLFHRIICVVRSDEQLQQCMGFELAPRPTALFDDISIRKGNKAQLIKELAKLTTPSADRPQGATHVVDGGFLLRKVQWPKGATYGTICDAYVTYVTSTYGVGTTVVFDGYSSGPSTKDVQHCRRASATARVSVSLETLNVVNQDEFLGNSENKANFIPLLAAKLAEAEITVQQAAADADVLIVKTAVELSSSHPNVVLVGEDTDLLVLLITHANPAVDVQMMMPGKQNTPRRVFSSQKLQKELGPMREFLPVIHALTGCDTTSAPFAKGKQTGFNLLRKLVKNNDPVLCKLRKFNDANASKEEIAAAGEAFLVGLYGGKKGAGLDLTRYRLYIKKAARQRISARFDIARLPPTANAAMYHSWRVFHQVQVWHGVELPPTDWGWREEEGRLVPVTTTMPAAPEYLLKLIFCNCRTVCGANCECRRAGMVCSTSCGFCSGDSCTNCQELIHEEDVDQPEDADQLEDAVILDEAMDIFATHEGEGSEEMRQDDSGAALPNRAPEYVAAENGGSGSSGKGKRRINSKRAN